MEMNELILKSFEKAANLVYPDIKFEIIYRKMTKIKNYEDIKIIAEKEDDLLFPFIPAIVFHKLGYDEYLNCDLNIESNETYILFRPDIVDHERIISELNENDEYFFERKKIVFFQKLVALLYGGFPWFLSYYSACEMQGYFGETAFAYKVRRRDNKPCVNQFVQLKNKYRDNHSDEMIRIPLENYYFDGIVHSFHTPNCIENTRHCQAIESCIL